MKVFVTGVSGLLGYDVVKELKRRNYKVIGSDIKEPYENYSDKFVLLDITDQEAVMEIIVKENPDVVIHCAAFTNVDLAEVDTHSAVDVNLYGTTMIACACNQINCKMIFISTDYVFDGTGDIPWKPDSVRNPLNVYGLTKVNAEEVVKSVEKFFIVRTSWLFGNNGKNFVRNIINYNLTHDTVRVVNDQIGSPTYSYDLARLLVDMAESDKYGVYHATNEGDYISWYDFTCEIFNQVGWRWDNVISVSTEEYGLNKAKRPLNSRLDKSKLTENGFEPLPNWKDALKRYLERRENHGKD